MQVRSDFKVSLKLKDQNGKVHDLGSYAAETTAPEGEQRSRPVPHLQRLSPDQRWLASFDADRMRLDLRAVDGSRAGRTGDLDRPLVLSIAGVEGTVRQFRWLESIQGLEVATDENLYILPFDPESSEKTIEGLAVFDKSQMRDFQIADTRIVPDGMIVHVHELVDGDPYWYRGEVYFARIADGTVQELTPLVPDHLSAVAANVRSNGRIVLALGVHDYDRAEPLGQGDLSELWTVETKPNELPRVVETHPCGDGQCNVSNWAPRTKRLTYTLAWENEIVIEGSGPGEEDVQLLWPEDSYEETHTLWSNATEDQYLAANVDEVRLWDDKGVQLWSWAPKSRHQVHFAHFEPDGSVIAAAGTRLYRIEGGKAKRILRTRGKYVAHRANDDEVYDPWGESTKDSFIDDAITLPNGAVAFSVVDMEESWEEMEWEGSPWDEGDGELADPFGMPTGEVDKIHAVPDPDAFLQGLDQQKAPDQQQGG